jgi:hypothetical protein
MITNLLTGRQGSQPNMNHRSVGNGPLPLMVAEFVEEFTILGIR